MSGKSTEFSYKHRRINDLTSLFPPQMYIVLYFFLKCYIKENNAILRNISQDYSTMSLDFWNDCFVLFRIFRWLCMQVIKRQSEIVEEDILWTNYSSIHLSCYQQCSFSWKIRIDRAPVWNRTPVFRLLRECSNMWTSFSLLHPHIDTYEEEVVNSSSFTFIHMWSWRVPMVYINASINILAT